jgi:hypothetical protein
MVRTVVVLAFTFSAACGGRIEGSGTASQSDAGNDGSDPLGGGGHLLTGMCRFKASFEPNGQSWIPLTDAPGLTTASRSGPSSFTLSCAGTGNQGFYYQTATEAITTKIGTQTLMGTMYQTSNGREREVAVGSCVVIVTSDVQVMGREMVTGTFDCPNLLDDPIGHFAISGSFTVPLP